MAKVVRTRDRLEHDLCNQLRLLRRSCGGDFDDEWDFAEGINVVARLRVLCHHTASSHSLLGQLGLRGGRFLDARGPGETLVIASAFGPWPRFLAPYEPYDDADMVPFDDWWTGVPVSVGGYSVSRKEVVTTLSNVEGGSHVDPKIPAGLAHLQSRGSGWYFINDDGVDVPVLGWEWATARNIGFELLWSLEHEHPEFLTNLRARFGGD